MTPLFILAGVVLVVLVIVGIVSLFKGDVGEAVEEKRKYDYRRKQFFLTRAEHECYDALVTAVGQEYHVFAQVHLPTILDHTIKGQDWRAALAHINRKSVDFVLCDKAYISPKLAIELDDKTHERPDRIERDGEVERILKAAGLPLLRLENHGKFVPEDMKNKVQQALSVR